MKQLQTKELTENFFEIISKEWMLVTAGTVDKFNTMTASWGGIGFLWNKTVAFVFIRPERYTHEFTEKNEFMTLSFLGENHRDIYNVCGTTSGRTTDKIAATGLNPLSTPNGNVTFEQARLTLECRKLYAQPLNTLSFIDKQLIGKWYNAHGGMHDMYIVEIVNIWKADH